MNDTHPGYEWEKGKPPKRVEVEDMPVDLAKMPEIKNDISTHKGIVGRLKAQQDKKHDRRENLIELLKSKHHRKTK